MGCRFHKPEAERKENVCHFCWSHCNMCYVVMRLICKCLVLLFKNKIYSPLIPDGRYFIFSNTNSYTHTFNNQEEQHQEEETRNTQHTITVMEIF